MELDSSSEVAGKIAPRAAALDAGGENGICCTIWRLLVTSVQQTPVQASTETRLAELIYG
jgi:hypothetical protein